MKRKIKLRDLTAKQWDENKGIECNKCKHCDNCKFGYINCDTSNFKSSWINNKDMFSDKFLNQEIEIEGPDILSEAEKEYLSAVIKPFRDRVIFIKKVKCANNNYFISIKISSELSQSGEGRIYFPFFQNDMYKGMEANKKYTLEELDL